MSPRPNPLQSRRRVSWGTVLVLLLLVATCVPYVTPLNVPNSETSNTNTRDTGDCRGLTKVHLDQHDATIFTPFVQFLRFMADVPDLAGFTAHGWFNIDATDKNATFFTYVLDKCHDHWPGLCIDKIDSGACSCAEAHANGWCSNNDFVKSNCRKTCGFCNGQGAGAASTLISLKFVSPRSWELMVMGMQVLVADCPTIQVGTWHHILTSWNREEPTSFWVDGNLIYHNKQQKPMRSLVIPGGGEVKMGQSEAAIAAGVDQGEGLQGWITLFNLDSRSIKSPTDRTEVEKIKRLYSHCEAIPRGHDIIEWVTTPHKGHGGITTQIAQETCHHF